MSRGSPQAHSRLSLPQRGRPHEHGLCGPRVCGCADDTRAALAFCQVPARSACFQSIVRQNLPLLRCMVLDREAYAAVVKDPLMTTAA